MATLSALRTDLLTRFQDKNGGFLSATPANLYINIACEDFQEYVRPCFREYGFYIEDRKFRYDLPSDFIHSRAMMWYEGSPSEVKYLDPQTYKRKGFLDKLRVGARADYYTIIDNDLYIYPAPNFDAGTELLNGAINSSVTILTVDDSTVFQAPAGMVLIDSEQISYQNNTTGDELDYLIRGEGGTTAASHLDNATVKNLVLQMVYDYSHTYMTSDSQSPAFPARYHRLIVHYALHLALKQDGREEEAKAEFDIYATKRLDAKREVRRQTRDIDNRRIFTPYD